MKRAFKILLAKKFFLLFILALFILLFLKACVYEPYFGLHSEELEVKLGKWNQGSDDIRIAVVSDLHAGVRIFEQWRLKKVVDAVNAQQPDIILILGDFVNGPFYGSTAMDPSALSKILSKLHAPLGVYGITGNHDLGYRASKLYEPLKNAGIRILRDENLEIKTSETSSFYLAGVGFRYKGKYRFDKALKGIPKGAPILLMAHSPDNYPDYPEEVSMIFAGHTHGGQIKIPFISYPLMKTENLPNRRADGLFVNDKNQKLYVTRGVGTSLITARFFCPPKFEIIKIKKGD